jgi:hypothetical protein
VGGGSTKHRAGRGRPLPTRGEGEQAREEEVRGILGAVGSGRLCGQTAGSERRRVSLRVRGGGGEAGPGLNLALVTRKRTGLLSWGSTKASPCSLFHTWRQRGASAAHGLNTRQWAGNER